MIDDDVKNEFRKLDERLGRVEQILPTLVTKNDLRVCATKDDLRQQRQQLDAVIATLAAWGIEAYGKRDAPGVYVDGRKIASVGLRIRRGRSYHRAACRDG